MPERANRDIEPAKASSADYEIMEGSKPQTEATLRPEAVDGSPALRWGLAAGALLVALLSFFVLAGYFSSPQAFAGTIESLDVKKGTVTGLVAAATAASAAISALPGDLGTPIAEKLADLSTDFLIVLTAIYLEKYLLTIFGFASFKLLIPIACILIAVAIALRIQDSNRRALVRLSSRLALVGIAIVLVVPASVFMSNLIEQTYADSVEERLNSIEATTEAIEDQAQGQQQEDGDADASQGFFQGLAESISHIPESVSEGVSGVTEEAQRTLNNFVEALAVMIVTSCIIPILVLVFFLWLVKVILGVGVDKPMQLLVPRSLRHGVGRKG